MSLPKTTAEALITLVEALDYSGMLKSAPDEVLLAVGHARSRLSIDKGIVAPAGPLGSDSALERGRAIAARGHELFELIEPELNRAFIGDRDLATHNQVVYALALLEGLR